MSSTANSAGARAVANIVHGYSNLLALEKTPPLVVSRGDGVRIIDEDGKDYIEGAAGMCGAPPSDSAARSWRTPLSSSSGSCPTITA